MHAQGTIVDDLNSTKPGQGLVRIYEDEAISGLIGKRPSSVGLSTTQEATTPVKPSSSGITPEHLPSAQLNPSATIQISGYKIQVFSGNDQRNSKREAESRRNQVKNVFPEMEVDISFNPPVWRVRAGNYRTYEEAFQSLQEMKKTFPDFGKEMQIVRARVLLQN